MNIESLFHAAFPKVETFRGVLAGITTRAEITNEDHVNRSGESFSRGVEIGGVNYAESLTGAQAGAMNWVEILNGVQLGIVNVSYDGNYFSLGLLNIKPNAREWYQKVVPFVRVNFE